MSQAKVSPTDEPLRISVLPLEDGLGKAEDVHERSAHRFARRLSAGPRERRNQLGPLALILVRQGGDSVLDPGHGDQ